MINYELPQNIDEHLVDSRYKFVTDPEMRKSLAEKTLQLIERIEEQNIKHLIFLDKSARPLSTLFLEMWERRKLGKARPSISFINIGKETNYGFKATPKDLDEYLQADGELDRIRETYRYLAEAEVSERVVIVDECSYTNETIDLATQILQKAFPDLAFRSFVYLRDQYPPWWGKKEEDPDYGLTGVIDSFSDYNIMRARRRGNYLTARPVWTHDRSAFAERTPEEIKEVQAKIVALRNEMKSIAEDYFSALPLQ